MTQRSPLVNLNFKEEIRQFQLGILLTLTWHLTASEQLGNKIVDGVEGFAQELTGSADTLVAKYTTTAVCLGRLRARRGYILHCCRMTCAASRRQVPDHGD
ncbi:hypothetical protein RRG08_038976 [Elysia crispata]|uniref:Uncharacterized protein n=1 Tax=Elysia crispata TaxID=231223 RepID=A0AAE0Y733_9GAST|nr:hypothetical protein RRG08_038976 [Elysia crispata]